ncbi:helix-turn-helix domain-containing protein [Salinicola tamaricis]|uniref:helix-turn-helix domain-containing protein n=1 Tax=Salinicola tamaricis TaxID=1771309 RepID=UPI001F5C13B1|nr:helix-turn-helix domain-containing protein [Salinicola tamaricis]
MRPISASASASQQTGLSPYQFVMRQRLEAARHLVTTSDTPLSEIAERTGFANQSGLSHAFRRHFGYPPVTLRRQTLV